VQEPLRVRLVLHLVPDADQRAVELRELGGDVGGEVDPADDAEDERRGARELEQLARLVERAARLDEHGAGHTVRAQ
jgi:hypothetical protein